MTTARPHTGKLPSRGTNRRLRRMLFWYGFTHPGTPIPPWRMGLEADAIRRRHFADLVAHWCAEGRLACECCGRRGSTVGYTGHIGRCSIMCSGCVFGVECRRGLCSPAPLDCTACGRRHTGWCHG